LEQLRPALGWLKTHHFWVLTGMTSLIAMISWYITSGNLRAEFRSLRSEIDGTFRTAQQPIMDHPNHPNQSFDQEMQKIIGGRREQIESAWQAKYDKIRNEVFVWPDNLSEKFREFTNFEQIKDSASEDPVAIAVRQDFVHLYLKEELPKLADFVKAQWHTESSNTASLSLPNNSNSNKRGRSLRPGDIVDWDPESQKQLFFQHFFWGNDTPSTREVLYAQEDLWVLQRILEIIGKTNADVAVHRLAAVKRIEAIHIGRDLFVAPKDKGPMARKEFYRRTRQGKSVDDKGSESDDPADQRYVDHHFEPIPRLTLKGSPNLTFTVMKRLPIRLRLVVDQTRVDELLINLADSALPIEVRQLDINPQAQGRAADNPAMGVRRRGFNASRCPIELSMVAYIFNPVNGEMLAAKPGDVPPLSAVPLLEEVSDPEEVKASWKD